MNTASLDQAFALAIANLLAGNRSYFGAGGPGYYGVKVENVSPDGSEFDVILTFKSGVRYCCVEPGCHVSICGSNSGGAAWFKKVRDGLKAAGIEVPAPMIVRKLLVVVEMGVICDGPREALHVHETRLEFDSGPFHETDGAEGADDGP